MKKIWYVRQYKEYEIEAASPEEAWRKWMASDWSTVLEEEPEACSLYNERGDMVEVD